MLDQTSEKRQDDFLKSEADCLRESGDSSDESLCSDDDSVLIRTVTNDLGGVNIGGFQIIDEIGEGSTGTVYSAQDPTTGMRVAIKMLKGALVSNTVAMKRFQQEIETIKRINHPNVAQVYGSGIHGQRPYIIMEYISGVTLSEYISKNGPLSPEQGAKIFRQVALALLNAHDHKIVHRDVKPSNLMIDAENKIKVVDFGLARILSPDDTETAVTRTTATNGTPAYMSPEQCLGRTIDERSDIYALGCVMYECLSGTRVFASDNPFMCMHQHTTQAPERLDDVNKNVPRWLGEIVMICLNKNPNARFQSMRELEATLGGAPTKRHFDAKDMISPESPSGRSVKRISRAGVLLVLSLVISVGFSITLEMQRQARFKSLFSHSNSVGPPQMVLPPLTGKPDSLIFEGVEPINHPFEDDCVVGMFNLKGPIAGTLTTVKKQCGFAARGRNCWYLGNQFDGAPMVFDLATGAIRPLPRTNSDLVVTAGLAFDKKSGNLFLLGTNSYDTGLYLYNEAKNAWTNLFMRSGDVMTYKGLAYSGEENCLYTLGIGSDPTIPSALLKLTRDGKLLKSIPLKNDIFKLSNTPKIYWPSASVQLTVLGPFLVIKVCDDSSDLNLVTLVLNKITGAILAENHVGTR